MQSLRQNSLWSCIASVSWWNLSLPGWVLIYWFMCFLFWQGQMYKGSFLKITQTRSEPQNAMSQHALFLYTWINLLSLSSFSSGVFCTNFSCNNAHIRNISDNSVYILFYEVLLFFVCPPTFTHYCFLYTRLTLFALT